MNNIERVQEILNRGLYDKLDGDKRARVDEAISRGLVKMPDSGGGGQPSPSPQVGEPQFPQQQQPPQMDMSQQFPEGARNTMNVGGNESTERQFIHPDKRAMAGMAGGALGTVAGMGNPISGAAGYALGDLLYQKFAEGKEIKAGNAAKRFAEGLAYEYAPKAAFAVGGRLIGKLPSKSLYAHGLGVPSGVIQKEADKLGATGLKHELVVSQNGLAKADDILGQNKVKAGEALDAAEANGVTVDLEAAVKQARVKLLEEYKDVVLSAPDVKTINKTIDEVLSEFDLSNPATYKPKKGQPVRERQVGIKLAQSIKSKTQKMTNNEYTNAVRFNAPVKDLNKYHVRAAIARELRSSIEKAVPDIVKPNAVSHEVMAWRGQAAQRVRHAKTMPLIPTKILAPAIIETSMKGGLGTASVMGATGVVSGSAAPLSWAGVGTQKASRVGNNYKYWLQGNKAGTMSMAGALSATGGKPPSDDFYSDIHQRYLDVLNYKPKKK